MIFYLTNHASFCGRIIFSEFPFPFRVPFLSSTVSLILLFRGFLKVNVTLGVHVAQKSSNVLVLSKLSCFLCKL